ncbi:MAG: flagellar hook-associated protein FlgL [Chitinivibrionales bacterium]|nr:flagellar hook-associated protein FlgL [Chitinivibrionales bacterium]
MRITSNALTRNIQTLLNDRYSDMTNVQEQLGTGKRLLRPSDNPIDVGNDIKLRTSIAKYDQYKTNINDGMAFMNVTDTAMQSMDTLVQRARELALEGSSDTLSASDRLYIQQEVDQLFRQIVSVANTNYKGDYIFSGAQTKIAPFPLQHSAGANATDYSGLKMAYFNAAGGPGTYQLTNAFDGSAITDVMPGSLTIKNGPTTFAEGRDFTLNYATGQITVINPAMAADVSPGTANYALGAFSINFDYLTQAKDIYGDNVASTGLIQREIESGVTMPINITGDELMRDPNTGTSMTDTMINLGQSLLHNNQPGIQRAIGDIDNVLKTLLAAQAKNGARTNRFETTLTRNGQQNTDAQSLQSQLEDVDMATAATQFSSMQNVYSAALKSASMLIQQSLVNYL